MKVTIELDLIEIDHIAAIHSLVRLFEIAESDSREDGRFQRPHFDELGFLKDEEFWSSSIPKAFEEVMGIAQFLLTYGYEDKLAHHIFHSDEWKSAIRWLKQETADLDEHYTEAEYFHNAREAQANMDTANDTRRIAQMG